MNLLEFANEMHKELENNKHKSGWEDLSPQWIINRIRQEVDELERAIQKKKPVQEVISECADIANFAYFLAHNQSRLKRESDLIFINEAAAIPEEVWVNLEVRSRRNKKFLKGG